MSEWNAGYYGSGLRLNEEEFMSFLKRYLALKPERTGNGNGILP